MNDYRREVSAFAERQTALNADTQRRIGYFGESREMSEAYVNQRLLALRVAGEKDTIETYELLAAPNAADIIARSSLLAAPVTPSPPPVVKFDPAGVEKLTRQLNSLRKPPTFWDRVRKTIAYREGLRAAYEKSMAEATAATGDAASQGAIVQTGTAVPVLPTREQE